MGTVDIYEVVERLPEIQEALVVGVEQPDGGYWMPLFVAVKPGVILDEALRIRINEVIRTEVSPRHVPDEILAVPGIPHTLTGKKLEVPVKRILQGASPTAVVSVGAIDRPDLIDYFVELYKRRSLLLTGDGDI